MTDRKQQAKSIFMNALELATESERANFLRDQCGGDPELRQEVEQLLQHCDEIDGFLDAPVLKATEEGDSEMLGRQIGPYKILQQIGEGGFGIVYMAEQLEPVRRKVALKLVKPGMDSKQVIARFESERQALALMDHPNIAKALDAGVTEEGRPYFVMELIHGRRITQFCDENRLTTPQRLELFVHVCRAIQHAHQRGIIHRDVKPSNVLVSLYDGNPVPKVIDFGVAKAVGQQLTEKTMFTQFGQVIGTPDYMSPEQATLNQLEVDTRSDIYGLGAVLYELLAGVPPFEPTRIRSAAFDEMLRIIREEDPQRPSKRLSTTADAATISQQRGTQPVQLSRALHGDLDWIVMKALDKQRDRRYETANNFAEDIRRYLDNDVVEARPPSTSYKVQKFVARNRGFVIATALLLTSLCIGLVGTSVGFFSAREQGKIAREEGEKAKSAQNLAERSAEQNRHLAFTSGMQLAQELWNGQLGSQRQISELVTAWIPLDGQSDLREFAWRYQWTQLHQRAHLTKTDTHRAAISIDGHLITADEKGIHEWDDDGDLLANRWKGDARQTRFSPNGRWAAVPESESFVLINLPDGTVLDRVPGNRCAFSTDSQLLGTWTAKSPVELWNLAQEKPKPLGQLPGPTEMADWDELQIAPGGKTSLKWWNESSNQEVSAFIDGQDPMTWSHRSAVRSIAMSTDGERMAVGTYTGKVYLRKVSVPNQTTQIATHGKPIFSICFSPNSKLMATGGADGTIDVWEIGRAEPKLIRTIKAHIEQAPVTGKTYGIRSLAFSIDMKRLASVDSAGVSKLWVLKDLDNAFEIQDYAEDLYGADLGISFKNGDEGVEVAKLDSNIFVDNEVGGEPAIQIGDRIVGVSDTAEEPQFDLAGKDEAELTKLVSQGRFGSTAIVYLERDGERRSAKLTRANRLAPSPHRIAFSPNGKALAIADGVHGATLWSLADMTARRLPALGVSVAFTPDERYLVMDDLKELVIWDLHEGKVHARLDIGFAESTKIEDLGASIAVSSDGRFLAAGTGPPFAYTRKSALKIWDLTTLHEIHSPLIENRSVFVAVSFTPNSDSLVAVDHGGMLRVWSTKDWTEPPREWRVGRAVSMAMSPDGKTVAVGRWKGRTVSLWDLETAEQIQVLGEHVAFGLAFSPDGRNLVSTGYDHNVFVWGLETGTRVRSLPGHTDYVAGVAFSPDGNVLATVGNEGTLRLWRAEALQNIDRHPITRRSMFQLGQAQIRQRHFAEASGTLRRTLELQQASLPGDHKDIVATRNEIVRAMRGQKKQPAIAQHPTSVKVAPGTSAELTVAVGGDGPWAYEWFHNDEAVSGATDASLKITAVKNESYGRYFVRVLPLRDNQTIATQSETAYLVNPANDKLQTGVEWEVFQGINGSLVSSFTSQLPYRHQANTKEVLDSFEIPTNTGNQYGGRLTGLLVPPKTGDYVFYLCADDNSELYLSANDLPDQSKLIAKVTSAVRSRQWETLSPESISQPIRLEAGKRYSVKALFKENGWSDHLAVAWQLPGEPPPKNDAEAISGDFLGHRR